MIHSRICVCILEHVCTHVGDNKRIVWSAVLKQNTENHRKNRLLSSSIVPFCNKNWYFGRNVQPKNVFPHPTVGGLPFFFFATIWTIFEPMYHRSAKWMCECESLCLTGFVSLSFNTCLWGETSYIPTNSLTSNNCLALRDHLHSCSCHIYPILSNSERSLLPPQLSSCFFY